MESDNQAEGIGLDTELVLDIGHQADQGIGADQGTDLRIGFVQVRTEAAQAELHIEPVLGIEADLIIADQVGEDTEVDLSIELDTDLAGLDIEAAQVVADKQLETVLSVPGILTSVADIQDNQLA